MSITENNSRIERINVSESAYGVCALFGAHFESLLAEEGVGVEKSFNRFNAVEVSWTLSGILCDSKSTAHPVY